MREFEKLFNAFTISAVIILLLTTVVAGSVAVINRGKSNILSYAMTQNRVEFNENCVIKL